jgi:hypothetical protein
MIRRDKGEMVCECDDCGHTTEGVIVGVTDFHEFVRELKDHGWTVRKDEDDEWRHYCSPDCAD